MAGMLARALQLGPSPFSARLLGRRNQRVPLTTPFAPPAPGAAGGSASKQNRAPNPTTPGTFVTAEDTARSIVLTATDPDGDPMSFEVTATTTNGTLSGTAPNLTYTPDQDFNGTDQFTYRVTDSQGASASETIPRPRDRGQRQPGGHRRPPRHAHDVHRAGSPRPRSTTR